MADNEAQPGSDLAHDTQDTHEVWDLTMGITTNRYLGPPALRLIKGGASERSKTPSSPHRLSLVTLTTEDRPIRGRGCSCPACEEDRHWR